MNTRRLAVMITPLALCLILASGTRGWAEELKNGVGIGPFMLAAYSSSSHDSEDLKIGAGAAPTENIFNQIKEPMEKSIGLKMAVISNGPVAAWKELDNGTVHAASAGLSFSDWVALMQKEGYRIADQDQYHHWEIGVDSGRVIFNRDLNIPRLTNPQIKGIFTGAITNWKEVGGPDLPIKVILGTKIPGTLSYFQQGMMDSASYVASAVEATTAADVKEKVIATPGSVGLGPVSIVDISIKNQGLPIPGRPITLITKGAPSPAVTRLLNYISGEGRQYIFK